MLAGVLAGTRLQGNTVVPSVLSAAGVGTATFVAEGTPTVVSVFSMQGTSQVQFVSEDRRIVSAALAAQGASLAQFEGLAVTIGPVAAAIVAFGSSLAEFKGADAQVPPIIIACKFITGPENVIPVEIVEHSGPDVLVVTLADGEGNFMPIYEDPTHPKRIKVRFV